MHSITPGHLTNAQRKILRAVALAYRRVMRAPREPAAIRAEEAQLAQKRQSEALADCRVSPAELMRDRRQARGLGRGQPDDPGGDQRRPEMVPARSGCLRMGRD